MGKTPKRFSIEYIEEGKLYLSVVEEEKQASLVLTLKVNNYSKLRKRVFYYKAASFGYQFSWRFELAKVKGTLFAIFTTRGHNKTVYFYIDNVDPTKTIIRTAVDIMDTSHRFKSVYVSEFCNRAIMDLENKFLPGDVLTVICKYDIEPKESIDLLLPLEQVIKNPDVQAPNDYFKNIYLKSICADFTIIVNDSWFMVHRRLLITHTKMISVMYEEDSLSTIRNYGFIDTFSHIMHRVLLYVYSGELEEMIPPCRDEIRRVAVRMGIPNLVKDVEKIFKRKKNNKKHTR